MSFGKRHLRHVYCSHCLSDAPRTCSVPIPPHVYCAPNFPAWVPSEPIFKCLQAYSPTCYCGTKLLLVLNCPNCRATQESQYLDTLSHNSTCFPPLPWHSLLVVNCDSRVSPAMANATRIAALHYCTGCCFCGGGAMPRV